MNLKNLIISIIMVLVFQILFTPTLSNAQNMGEVIQQGDNFVSRGNILIDQSKLDESMSFIFNSLFIVGMILTVFVGGFLGIKYIVASAEDKAEIKKTMIPFVVGSIVIFGAFTIWKVTVSILNEVA